MNEQYSTNLLGIIRTSTPNGDPGC